MSTKSGRIAALIEQCRGGDLEAHYLGYFECFNRQLFYEAHEVLEVLWLREKQGTNYSFYKGLIQLAGAFVHVQKHRLGPATALLKLAHANLEKYPVVHERLDVVQVLVLIKEWLEKAERLRDTRSSLVLTPAPRLELKSSTC